METTTLTIEFPDLSAVEANQYASELRNALKNFAPDVKADVHRANKTNQDFGSTLVLVLGTPAIILVAKGIKSWLDQRFRVKIRVKSNDLTVDAENISSSDSLKIVQEVLNRQINVQNK